MQIDLLYRGKLQSCSYDCTYCPFAKQKDTRATLAQDKADLVRFVNWIELQTDLEVNLLFTPWGEALTRQHYREALVYLSHLPHVEQVAIQTNLSATLPWLAQANPVKLALWCTYHPEQTSQDRFLQQIKTLQTLGIRHSVGMVGIRKFFGEIRSIRDQLPATTYLWINAYRDEGTDYYTPADIQWLSQLDPWFTYNLAPTPSLGASCRAGHRALSIDGDGNIQPCHFIDQPLGNLYLEHWQQALQPRQCTNTQCDCYIGYIHRKDLPLAHDFGTTRLSRIPLKLLQKVPITGQ